MCMLARALNIIQREGNAPVSFLKRAARIAHASMLSTLNNDHGASFTIDYFKSRFESIALSSPSPLMFNATVAGWLGSDGYYGHRSTRIFQANQGICEGLATAINTHTKGLISPTVRKTKSVLYGNIKRADFRVIIPKQEVGLMALHFGSFDFERRSQVLIQVLIVLIGNSDDFSQKELGMVMLIDFLSYVKKERPS
jgi:hypothetical protein